MKRILITILILLVFNCENDDLTEVNGDGSGGISCLVNGTVLKPKGGGFYGNKTARLDSNPDGSEFIVLGLSSNQEIFERAFLSIFLKDIDRNDIIGKTFVLGTESETSSHASLNLIGFPNEYKTNENYSGTVTILNFDLNTNVIVGAFSFIGENENGVLAVVTEGRFDMRL